MQKTSIIAIVDDDEATREALKLLLRAWGRNASTFSSAEDFLHSANVRDTSCLITDVHMPGLSGLDLQDRIIADGLRIPVIIMTGYLDENIRARAMKARAICVLEKPFNSRELLRCIEQALQEA
jgi:FixJ family two-component response regulator